MTRDDPSDFGVIRYWYTTFSPFPMKPNVHEYPESANERELLAYKIAVEQAALDGKPIEISKANRNQWAEYGVHDVPAFCWGEWHYRVARPKVAEGHNPDGLTEDQVETSKGYRLLTTQELSDPRQPGLQMWARNDGCWTDAIVDWVGYGHFGVTTYRTKAAPGQYAPKPVQPTTVLGWLNLLPDGYRERAFRNSLGSRHEWPAGSIAGALNLAFDWFPSPEGLGFWAEVHHSLLEDTSLPPLPDAPKKVVPWSLDNFVWPDCVRRRTAGGKVFGVQIADKTGLYVGLHTKDCESPEHSPIDWQELADDFEYSIDNGRTFQPCCRTEDAS